MADKVIFNSYYNMNSFLKSIPTFISIIPDYQPKQLTEKIAGKCLVLYFPIKMFPEMNSYDRLMRNHCSAEKSQTGDLEDLSNRIPEYKDEKSSIPCESVDENSVDAMLCLPTSQAQHVLHILWPHRW